MLKELLQKETTKILMLGFGLILIAIGIQSILYNFMDGASSRIIEAPLSNIDSIQKLNLNSTFSAIPANKFSALKNQYIVCDTIKQFYTKLGRSYYTNYYSFSISLIFFLALFIVASFLIGITGWINSTYIFKTFFLVTFIIVSIFYNLSTVLNNKNNVNICIEKIKSIRFIQADILSCPFDGKYKNVAQLDTLIIKNIKSIALSIDYPVAIDDSKLREEYENLKTNNSLIRQ